MGGSLAGGVAALLSPLARQTKLSQSITQAWAPQRADLGELTKPFSEPPLKGMRESRLWRARRKAMELAELDEGAVEDWRKLSRLDPDLAALTSCSDVYKQSLQLQRIRAEHYAIERARWRCWRPSWWPGEDFSFNEDD